MPRNSNPRCINQKPRCLGFLASSSREDREVINLLVEELECIRLIDYEGLKHHEACQWMRVSRPTLTRIYGRARKKIAQAIINGHHLEVEGGNHYYLHGQRKSDNQHIVLKDRTQNTDFSKMKYLIHK